MPFRRRHFQVHFLWIPIEISLKLVPKDLINNIPALVQIMAWCRPGDKPSYESMMVDLMTHVCVTRPQWVNWPDDVIQIGFRDSTKSSIVTTIFGLIFYISMIMFDWSLIHSRYEFSFIIKDVDVKNPKWYRTKMNLIIFKHALAVKRQSQIPTHAFLPCCH